MMKYGKIDSSGSLIVAPDVLTVDGVPVSDPTHDQSIAAGYKPILPLHVPPHISGTNLSCVADGWTEQPNAIVRHFKIVKDSAPVTLPDDPTFSDVVSTVRKLAASAIVVCLAPFALCAAQFGTLRATNDVYTADETRQAIQSQIAASGAVTSSKLSQLSQSITAVSNESQIVYRLYASSNVVDEITNYNSVARTPTRRMYSLTTNGYEKIWDEQTMHDETRRIAETNAAAQVAAEARRADAAYAPRAWSGVTSGMGAPAPDGVTWISTPKTVIAGGYEYAKYITSIGSVWILTANGTVDLSNTTNGYFKLANADGVEIISVERLKSHEVGINAKDIRITVPRYEDYNVITVPIDVDIRPTAYYCTNLTDAVWCTNNTDVATIEWTQTTDGYECTLTSASPELFIRFTVNQEGSAVIRNKAPISVDGGILCTDGIHKAHPVYSNGTITWEVVQ